MLETVQVGRFRDGGILLLMVGAVIASGCRKEKASVGFTPPPTAVEVAEAKTESVKETLHALGTIEASERVKVSAEIDAAVRALPFTEGGHVAKGQALAILNDSELKAEVGRAEALRDQARLNLQRFEQLSESQIASAQDRDNARALLQVAEADWRLAEARLAKTRIEAPFGGVVGSRMVSPGAFLRAGDVITDLARIDPVKVAFAVPERYLAEIKRDARVSITTVAYPKKEFTGGVNVVDPILDPGTRSARLVAVIPNPRGELRPGMSADVTAVLAERPNAVTLPDEAVFAQGDRNYTYVVRADSTVTRRALELGTRDPGRVEVREGVRAGEKVVRAGHQKLFEGAKVVPVESAPSRGATKP